MSNDKRLQTQRVFVTNPPENMNVTGSSVTVTGSPAVTLPQIADAGNTTTYAPSNGTTQFVGAWYPTRSAGIVRQLTVLAALDSSGNPNNANLGGTFVFEYSENASTATISESRVITDFATVRDFDLLNAGAYYRVKFTPSRALTGSELVFITTTQRTQNDGAFVRLANQQIEEANAAMPQAFAYLKAFDGNTGKSVNLRPTKRIDGLYALEVDTNLGDKTVFGSLFSEGIYDSVSINFSTDVPAALTTVTTANGGTVTQSAAQAVLQSSTATNGQAIVISRNKLNYRPAHESRIDFTGMFTAGVAGAVQYLGLFDANNGFYVGFNGTTFVIGQRSNGVDTQVVQANWNGNVASQYTRSGVSEAIDFTKGNVYRIRFGWLGNAPIFFEVLAPDGDYAILHQIKYPNTSTAASIQNPDLPMRAEVTKTSGATNITLKSSSWRAGSVGFLQTGVPSRSNFSITTLGSGATYTGAYEPSIGHVSLTVLIQTDQISAIGGISVDWSDDGSTLRRSTIRTLDSNDVSSGAKYFAIPIIAQYFRVRYTNGATGQTNFFLQCILNTVEQQASVDGIESTMSSTSSAQMARSLIAAKNDSGTYGNIQRGPNGGFRVSLLETETPVQLKGLTSAQAGQATAIGTVTPTQIASPALTNRKSITVIADPTNTKNITIGFSNSAAACLFPLAAGVAWSGDVDATVNIYALAVSGSQNVQWIEVAGTP